MKKYIITIFLLAANILYSEELMTIESENFKFITDLNKDKISEVINFSEAFNTELDRVLKLGSTSLPREVIIFETQQEYNLYLEKINIVNRKDYIFLKYSDRTSKVILYLEGNLDTTSLAHHLALQYLDLYGNGAPEWFNLGIAVYFEDFSISNGIERKNKWIDSILNSGETNKIFTNLINSESNNKNYYFSWLLIDYLLNTQNRDHNRLLWDTLSFIKYSKSNNKKEVIIKDFLTYNLDNYLEAYFSEIKGYTGLMDSAINFYNEKKYKESINILESVVLLEPYNYSPDYYLGLCYSNLKMYNKATSHFSISLDKGAPKDITYYSIGVNFYLNKDFKQAKKYFNEIKDPAYKIMSEKVLDEISKY